MNVCKRKGSYLRAFIMSKVEVRFHHFKKLLHIFWHIFQLTTPILSSKTTITKLFLDFVALGVVLILNHQKFHRLAFQGVVFLCKQIIY